MSLPAPALDDPPRGVHLAAEDAEHFDAIASFAYRTAGLVLARDKAPMVLARIAKRMRALRVESLADYRRLVERQDADDERRELLFTLTTNVTSFMREAHHFEILRARILPGLAARARSGARVRLWSAGCSSGQEPYSIAMEVLTAIPEAAQLDIRILATDIDAHVLDRARTGEYPEAECETLGTTFRSRFLERCGPSGGAGPRLRMGDAVRSIVRFRELNLIDRWPMQGKFDVVFCRNVLIYFDRETQEAVIDRFAAALQEDGHLFVGHSERIDTERLPLLRPIGTTAYQRSGPNPYKTGRD